MEKQLTEKQRTIAQNKAIHVYFQEMAQLLTESGIDVQLFLKDFEISYSPEMIKNIWRNIAKEKFQKDGTSQLTTTELQAVYEEFNRHVAKHGIHLPFPSVEAQNFEEWYNDK